MSDYEELSKRIANAFLDKWNEELKQVHKQMADVDNLDWRNFLTAYDPTLSKLIEGNSREVVQTLLEKLALAKAVSYAILTALQNYPQGK
jgi:hypothetical protein